MTPKGSTATLSARWPHAVADPSPARPSEGSRDDSVRINLHWLVRLRWGAAAGQALTIVAVHMAGLMQLSLAPLLAVVLFGVATNVALAAWLRRSPRVTEGVVATVMVLDVALLTALLDQTGGPFNPFCFLYLVHIALAAVILEARYTWALSLLSVSCLGALFLGDSEGETMDHATHMERMNLHMEGMWVAMAVAAAFIVYFVTRVRRALTEREGELAAAREVSARQERLASLATLAAGAAHELATPLSSIAVAARELTRRLEAERRDPEDAEDARVIRQEVARCRLILDHMAASAGQTSGEGAESVTLVALLEEAREGVPGAERIHVALGEGVQDVTLVLPPRGVAQALRVALKNAVEASPDGAEVELAAARVADERLSIVITDRGAGMPRDVLARAGEPFFTTKGPGRGMGLGLFLSRAIVERLGGALALVSVAGQGTRVTFELPMAPPKAPLH